MLETHQLGPEVANASSILFGQVGRRKNIFGQTTQDLPCIIPALPGKYHDKFHSVKLVIRDGHAGITSLYDLCEREKLGACHGMDEIQATTSPFVQFRALF
jgi:hypothetical protein